MKRLIVVGLVVCLLDVVRGHAQPGGAGEPGGILCKEGCTTAEYLTKKIGLTTFKYKIDGGDCLKMWKFKDGNNLVPVGTTETRAVYKETAGVQCTNDCSSFEQGFYKAHCTGVFDTLDASVTFDCFIDTANVEARCDQPAP